MILESLGFGGIGLVAKLLPKAGKAIFGVWQERERHKREIEMINLEVTGKIKVAEINVAGQVAISNNELVASAKASSDARYSHTQNGLQDLAESFADATGWIKSLAIMPLSVYCIRASIVPTLAYGSMGALMLGIFFVIPENLIQIFANTLTLVTVYFLVPNK